MAKQGRPKFPYTKEIAEEICSLLALGVTVKRMCRENEHFPSEALVRKWALDNIKENPEDEEEEGFYALYARARDIGLDAMSEEIFDIADDGSNDYITKTNQDGSECEVFNGEHVQRSRLRVDTRKWYLAKLAPKRYGDKLELSGNKDEPLVVERVLFTEKEEK